MASEKDMVIKNVSTTTRQESVAITKVDQGKKRQSEASSSSWWSR
jgi:hypothetical protein